MIRRILPFVVLSFTVSLYAADPPEKVAVGSPAPTFKIKDSAGKEIDLADLTAKGPVLVRLTCGCAGCDQELSYFLALNDAYKTQGLTCLFVFKELDTKIAK